MLNHCRRIGLKLSQNSAGTWQDFGSLGDWVRSAKMRRIQLDTCNGVRKKQKTGMWRCMWVTRVKPERKQIQHEKKQKQIQHEFRKKLNKSTFTTVNTRHGHFITFQSICA